MDVRSDARRELVLLVVVLVALARPLDPAPAALVAVVAFVTVLVAGMAVYTRAGAVGWPVRGAILPAVLTAGAAGAIRLVPIGLELLAALAVLALAASRVVALEERVEASSTRPTRADRVRVTWAGIVAAFVAFAGVAALVPDGLGSPGDGSSGLSEPGLALLVAGDALVAALVGFRLAALREIPVDSPWPAVSAALATAIAAGAIRAVDLPRLVGPAVLTLVLYLWDALHATAPARRRDARFVWETALLAIVAGAVVVWNLGARG